MNNDAPWGPIIEISQEFDPVPAVLRVCVEARMEALKHYVVCKEESVGQLTQEGYEHPDAMDPDRSCWDSEFDLNEDDLMADSEVESASELGGGGQGGTVSGFEEQDDEEQDDEKQDDEKQDEEENDEETRLNGTQDDGT